jgi:uncharacterized protein YndB with AHSA1/START domain
MTESRGSVSDEKVREATGRGWAEWEAALDALGAADLSHKEIVALLGERCGVESSWWRQQVTVTYERRKGRRVLGETAGTGFQVGVRRTIAVGHEEAWRVLTSPEGVRAWLGDAPGLRLEKGQAYTATDGATGEVRVIKPGSHLRITWHPAGWARPSTIQLRADPAGEKTIISFHQEHLPGAEERAERRRFYEGVLDELRRMLEK